MIQRSERFTKAYDSLITAFYDGTLAKCTCLACACGNILLSALGIPPTREDLREALSARKENELSKKERMAIDLWSHKRQQLYTPYGLYGALPEFVDKINTAGYTTEE